MSAPASKLNLRPNERRLVAFVGIVLFVVLNIWLVWPHFNDWGQLKMRQERARRTLENYRAEIAKVPGYRVKLRELESAGSSVVPEEQDLNLVVYVNNQVHLNRLYLVASDPKPRLSSGTQTNRFFEEQSLNLHVTSGNEELVNFLVSLTSTNSLIRVKDLTVKADAAATRLDGNMTLIASYQRATPVRASAAPARAVSNVASVPKPAVVRAPPKIGKPAANAALTNRVALNRLRPTNQPARKP